MQRVLAVLAAVGLLAACGSGGGDAIEDLKQALIDDGATEAAAECAAPGLVEMGYTADDISDSDSEPSDEAIELYVSCLGDDVFGDMMSDLSDSSGPQAYGDDPELDALYDACADGDLAACDDLYMEAPFGSDYEAFGLDCGGNDGESALYCSDSSQSSDDPEPQAYGDDPELDALYDACDGGDYASCDELYWSSALGSEYEDFGLTCGNRIESSGLSCEDAVS